MALPIGQNVEIKGEKYIVVGNPLDGRAVRLKKTGAEEQILTISRNELASLLVIEKATLIDELDIPDSAANHDSEVSESESNLVKPVDSSDDGTSLFTKREITDISHMQLARILDWHGKIYILKCLMPLGARSPKSSTFRTTVSEASMDLKEWLAEVGISGPKKWSEWTLYHDLLRWRQQRYELAAIQRKGLEYSPWKNRKTDFYLAAAAMARGLGIEFAHLSTEAVHIKLNAKINAQADTGMEAEQ